MNLFLIASHIFSSASLPSAQTIPLLLSHFSTTDLFVTVAAAHTRLRGTVGLCLSFTGLERGGGVGIGGWMGVAGGDWGCSSVGRMIAYHT